MIRLLSILFFMYFTSNLFGEGTKELRPTATDSGSVELNDGSRPFALESNSDPLHRLYIHINSTTENIYFGFQAADKIAGDGTFLIKDPSGTVVYPRTNIPVVAGAGYIANYSQAVAGPMIAGSPATGYNPLTFTPTTTGDYYIEFTTKIASYYFNLFDITVVNASNQPILGRLWSNAWDLSTRGGEGFKFNGTFYVYTADKYTTSVFFNQMEPYGFVVSCNSRGTQNSGNALIDRQSVDSNNTYPEYKIFLNEPDPNVYTSASIPSMIEDLSVIGSPITGSPVKFFLNMSKSGLVEIFLDLDGVSGYQAGNKDVVLVKNIVAGGDTIVWNGKDFAGAYVTQSVSVGITSRFSTGVTHLPIYDAEYHKKGYIVNRITPSASRAAVYWDDTKLAGGTINLSGASGDTDGHNWTANYGDKRTMNTWWNGYENENLKSFTFTMDGTYLPIELLHFTSLINNKKIQLDWQTASETNNDYFEILRSANGSNWEMLGKIKGAGNSTVTNQYNFIDQKPLLGLSYYRLKQVDFDGIFSHSSIISISNDPYTINKSSLSSYPNPAVNSITVELGNEFATDIEILTVTGKNVTKHITILKSENSTFSIDISNLENGTYILNINGDSNLFVKK